MPDARRALVTGASGGIGGAVVEALVAAGWEVVATGRDAGRLAALSRRLEPGLGSVRTVVADLRRPADRAHLVAQVTGQGGPLHAVVNNAGAATLGPTAELSDDDLDAHLAVNVRAPIEIVRGLLGSLRLAAAPTS
jgi:3-oxoacyl-[acyl-carrier protein] reductase